MTSRSSRSSGLGTGRRLDPKGTKVLHSRTRTTVGTRNSPKIGPPSPTANTEHFTKSPPRLAPLDPETKPRVGRMRGRSSPGRSGSRSKAPGRMAADLDASGRGSSRASSEQDYVGATSEQAAHVEKMIGIAKVKKVANRLNKFAHSKFRRLRDMYVQLDQDQDGRVSREEFVDALPALGFPITNKDALMMYKLVDRNNDGHLSFNEFHQM